MNISEFIENIPVTTRTRDSKIRTALEQGKIFVSVINKNNKRHYKIYYMNNNVVKTKQLKLSDSSTEYLKKNIELLELSEEAQNVLQ